MLSKIIIKKLYNLYNYEIDMGLNRGPIHFITAPNGYGKTTILEVVNAMLTSSYEDLSRIPFEQVSLSFDDNIVYSVEQKRTFEDIDITLDVQEKPKVELIIKLISHTDDNEVVLSELYVSSDSNLMSRVYGRGNIEMFLVSKTCHYLTDSRLMREKTDIMTLEQNIDAKDLNMYADTLKKILNDPIQSDLYSERINVFKRIIDRCDFASKSLEITKYFGFRFVADDAFKTKIPLDVLSSGEKHMIIQVFELIFNAQQGTLVLIDEPELSLHMMWQMNYLKNIREIARIRGFQYLIATHSPQIFNNIWSLTTDLYTNSLEEK